MLIISIINLINNVAATLVHVLAILYGQLNGVSYLNTSSFLHMPWDVTQK